MVKNYIFFIVFREDWLEELILEVLFCIYLKVDSGMGCFGICIIDEVRWIEMIIVKDN